MVLVLSLPMSTVSTRQATAERPRPSIQRLVRARVEAGFTQEELARAADVSLASISKYERGARTPGGERLRKIAAATGKPVPWFFEEAA